MSRRLSFRFLSGLDHPVNWLPHCDETIFNNRLAAHHQSCGLVELLKMPRPHMVIEGGAVGIKS